MLTEDEVAQAAADLESDLVERKESLGASAKDKVAQAVCAFANDLPGRRRPGLVLVGVDDAGEPTGLPITDELLRDLGAIRSDGNVLPLPTMTVRKVRLRGRDVAAVTVAPSSDTPVRYEGRVWVRVGPRRAVASRDEERILVEKRQAGDLPYDRQPVPGARPEDLDLELFRSTYLPSAVSAEVLAENRRSVPEQLAALHLLAPTGVPNRAAVLLLGRDPAAWMPAAYVQFVRFDGRDLTSPVLDQKLLGGRVGDVLRRADDLCAINIRVALGIEGAVTEQRLPDYPAAAVQQLLRNAVLHRTYEIGAPVYWYWFRDRIEIHSPGGLYGRVNEGNFGQPGVTDYRNQTLAEGLKHTGFVQRFGVGIGIARRRCAENGNPPPEFAFSPAAVVARVRSAR